MRPSLPYYTTRYPTLHPPQIRLQRDVPVLAVGFLDLFAPQQLEVLTQPTDTSCQGPIYGWGRGWAHLCLVSAGSRMASTNPRCAATMGLAKRSVYSRTFSSTSLPLGEAGYE